MKIRILNFLIRCLNFPIDLGNGIWSGFPLCCVWFYCTHHFKGIHPRKHPFDPVVDIGYVRCKNCIDTGHAVQYIRSGVIISFQEFGVKVETLEFSDEINV